jgi:hypothetical protein
MLYVLMPPTRGTKMHKPEHELFGKAFGNIYVTAQSHMPRAYYLETSTLN